MLISSVEPMKLPLSSYFKINRLPSPASIEYCLPPYWFNVFLASSNVGIGCSLPLTTILSAVISNGDWIASLSLAMTDVCSSVADFSTGSLACCSTAGFSTGFCFDWIASLSLTLTGGSVCRLT